MNKLSLTLAVTFVALLTSVAALAFTVIQSVWVESRRKYTVYIFLAHDCSSPTPTSTTTPRINITPTPDPAAEGSFGPKGYFRITSPINTTYNSGSLTLTVTGEAINQPLSMAYNIDGKDNVPFYAVVSQEHEWEIFVGGIHASVLLPSLASGALRIMVFGTLSGNSAQATVHFIVA